MRYPERKMESALRGRGYRLTAQRRAMLKAIARSHDHLTPAELHKLVRRQHPGIGLVTVYRTLDVLKQSGLLCEVHTGNGRSYVMRRPQGHHHHLVCTGCGTVADFTGCNLADLEKRVARQTGFVVDGHVLELVGLCHDCQNGAKASPHQ